MITPARPSSISLPEMSLAPNRPGYTEAVMAASLPVLWPVAGGHSCSSPVTVPWRKRRAGSRHAGPFRSSSRGKRRAPSYSGVFARAKFRCSSGPRASGKAWMCAARRCRSWLSTSSLSRHPRIP
jgi:hypothetical protein